MLAIEKAAQGQQTEIEETNKEIDEASSARLPIEEHSVPRAQRRPPI